MTADDVIQLLDYTESKDNWLSADEAESGIGHVWRAAQNIDVLGSYVYRTSPDTDPILPPKPAVHVVRADDENAARDIHRKLWNLSTAPFLIVILPNQVRVYAGFNFDPRKKSAGHIATAELTPTDISQKLKEFFADEIDSGRIWQTQAKNLTPEKRVDQRLLGSLKELGDELINNRHLDREVAHALIGKYIYIRFLKDRRILSDRWLIQHQISLEDVLGRGASRASLRRLVTALETRFNGKIFPLDLDGSGAPDDTIIAYVASVFRGDDPVSGQLALDFQAYDFSYIPIETLSSIYEQFLRREGKGNREGAVYTREFVADYLLRELNSVKPLERGMRILDPACGSGVFLVLVYRRLIEAELRKRRRKFLPPEVLGQILVESIYGIEPSRDACYVTEFSLILTLLSYVNPPDLDQNESFQFPALHNTNIFEGDFFNEGSDFWKKKLTFHWVTGNPPWTKLKSKTAAERQPHAWNWFNQRKDSAERPVGQYSLSEAFSWRVTDVLSEGGYVGLLLHATSLFNTYSAKYRGKFFKKNTIARITNFANLAYILFKGRADAPAATFIYTKSGAAEDKPPIIHYGPFVANQVFFRLDGNRSTKRAWAITIYEDEIQTVPPHEAESGDATVWKLALWGTHRDRKAVNHLKRLFPESLSKVKDKRGWHFHQGLELCTADTPDCTYLPALGDYKKLLDVNKMSGGFYLTVPEHALKDLTEQYHYIKPQSGNVGINIAQAPHIFWSVTFAAYSDLPFVLPKPQIGLSAPLADKNYLRAVSAYLNSSIGQYLLFFHAASWGVDRNKFAPTEAEPIPIPSFSGEQVAQLANLHKEVSEQHVAEPESSLFATESQRQKLSSSEVKKRLDIEVGRILRIPEYIRMLAVDFTQVRYQLNKGKTTGKAAQPATTKDLSTYARNLVRELDDFAEAHHKVSVKMYSGFVLCTIEVTRAREPHKPVVEDARNSPSTTLRKLWDDLEEEFSQWVYVRRSMRSFAGNKVRLLKSSRLIDWTKTQALLDSDDIIAEALNAKD